MRGGAGKEISGAASHHVPATEEARQGKLGSVREAWRVGGDMVGREGRRPGQTGRRDGLGLERVAGRDHDRDGVALGKQDGRSEA